jgi:transposase
VKEAVQRTPREAGIDLGDWNWKVVRQFVGERFGLALGRSSCLSYLHRLGFVLKRPKQRLLKAEPGASGALRAGVCAPASDGSSDRGEDLLRR